MPATDTTGLKRGTRVVAVADLPGVPEGTAGQVTGAVGLTLVRYRVVFDNGVDLTSVTHTKLVAEDEWDDFRTQRAAEAEAAAEPPPADENGASDAGGDGSSAGATDDRLAALLARSKAARERKTTTG